MDYDHAYHTFLQGNLQQAQEEAQQGRERFAPSQPDWASKFRALEAEALLLRGMSSEAIALLPPAALPSDRNVAISMLATAGAAYARLHSFVEAERALSQADQLCAGDPPAICGSVIRAEGVLAIQRGQLGQARALFARSLSFARKKKDRFLEATALLNLGASSLNEEHFDEAKDESELAYEAAVALGAMRVALVARGNSGWASYRLGDSEKALEAFQDAKTHAIQLGDVWDEENELTNIGYIYMDARRFDLAAQSFQEALKLADGIKAREDTYNALRVLARLALQTNDLDQASHYAAQALEIARESGNHADDLYPALVQGQIAARRGDAAEAEKTFRQVERDKLCPVFLKWEAEHRLATLYEDEKHVEAADREYRTALATFEAARHAVHHEDSQLSFLTNAARIYDDYVHFLVAHGKPNDALRWADYSRAQTLAEGLGLLSPAPDKTASGAPPALNARQIARRVKGTLLFYWLGEKQSYLWAIEPEKTQLFPLPPAPEIEAAVQRYRRALTGPQDVLASANEDGVALYRMLVSPAQPMVDACKSDSHDTRQSGSRPAVSARKTGANLAHVRECAPRVFILPDGELNNLNFETLIVSDPKPHYWIEDATIADASSLHLLSASDGARKMPARKLLLIGDSVAPSQEYPELSKAGLQMESVAQHFPAAGRQIFARGEATPAAYLSSHPEQFSHIHFVAHGTASRLSPLDSAIVLSRENTTSDSFKLYARDIIQHPLRADLVTISACYGAGERSYSGEGLVGLSWAFLRAGAHNVIAALWEATDVSTEQLMEKFYDDLDKGASPDAALRSAKLALMHGNFHHPFYWAPFQLYAGS